MNSFFGLFAKIIGPILAFLYNIINDYGFAIIALTVLVRLCMIPVFAKQLKTSAMMAELQPRIKDIQTRYATNRVKMNEEMQKVYSEVGYNPMSGCLPLLIQMPFLFGLFMLLRTPLQYMTQPGMVAAVHESFFWISDLCQPDPWILPLIAGISTYFTFSTQSQNDATGMMNGMKYFYPVLIFLIGRSFPAGLALYWAIGNVFTIVQNLFFAKKRKANAITEQAKKEVIKQRKEAQ